MRHFSAIIMSGFMLGTPVLADKPKIPGVESISFLSGWRNADGSHTSALRVVLEDGFKTYWRAPGGNGIPASFDFNGSGNMTGFDIHWPTPIAFDTQGATTLGYENELVLPISFQSADDVDPISLKANIQLGVCNDVCIPVQTNVSINLPANGKQDVTPIKAALRNQPKDAQSAGVRNITCNLNPIDDGFEITAEMILPQGSDNDLITTFELPHPDVWVTGAKTKIMGNKLWASAKIFVYADDGFFLDRSALRLTLLGDNTAVDIQGCPA